MKAAMPALRRLDDATIGFALGALGVLVFALSIPMTRLASGSADAPQLPAAFVAVGRAAIAGILAAGYLAAVRARRPRGRQWRALGITAAGVVFGWPLFLGYAVLHVDGAHASVIAGLLPLATAALGAALHRQRAGRGFWACAVAGCALVVAYAVLRGGGVTGGDALLLGAVLCGAVGYVSGAELAREMPPQQVISWVLVLALPVTLPLTLALWPGQPAATSSWAALLYLAVFSMWLGFFAWYRGLALGGTLRVSQVQLLQPFLSMLMCVPLLGETLDGTTVAFSLAVLATVALGKRLGA